jgi:hypothetical protein
MIIEDPSRTDSYRVQRPGAEALAAALVADRVVADPEQQVTRLIENLGRLTGAAADIAAQRINALNDDSISAQAKRDRLGTACRVTVEEDAL